LLLAAVHAQGEVFVIPHNDPDPDAIASAVALQYMLQQLTSHKIQIGYQGIIGRAENRALVRYLNHPLVPMSSDVAAGKPVVFVDTQPGTGNNPWQPSMVLAGVIDHHPLHPESSQAAFFDVRPDLGATATIIFGYFQTLNLAIPAFLATALFYGIKTDTSGLSRGVTEADAVAYFQLQSQMDTEALGEIERAQVPATYFKGFANALETTDLYDTVAVAHIGQMNYPDMAAEVADLLTRLEKVEWVLCTGVYRNKLLLAVRAPGRQGGAGVLVRAIVQDSGSAGGHGTMAGGQVPLSDVEPEKLVQVLHQRLKEVLKISPTAVSQPLIDSH
jgi:nanoRNase/pAp phosphatase (c-di-AMP/oligoRNAs hydrolase)